jgi:fucose permease
MLLFGALNGILDVSMNAHGVALERSMGRPIMSSMHAGWSLGGLLGAGGVALASVIGVAPPVAAGVATLVLLVLALIAIPSLGPGAVGTREGGARISLPSRAVLPLGLLGVLAAIIEGGIGDWAGLYLDQDLGMDAGIAALGFTVFALGLTLARFAGDRINTRYGAGRLLRGGMLVVAVTLTIVLLSANPIVALTGLVILGAGVANAIPLMFSAGGHIKPSGPSLAAVFTMCYTAFLAGPPVVGFIADHVGLPPTLAIIVGFAVVAAVVAPHVPGIDASNELERVAASPVTAGP